MRKIVIALGLVMIAAGLYYLWTSRPPAPMEPVPLEPVETTPEPVKPPPPKKPAGRPKEFKPSPELEPTPAKVHKELIPENIEIIRVYYPEPFTGPGHTIEFDINGSGFTREFREMITAASGHEEVNVRNLELKTPNQIHGELVVSKDAPSKAVYPEVLIDGKVVFRAPQPFYMIRPGEVLDVMFLSLGESGRTGQIRVLTNVTPEMFKYFKIYSSTPPIVIDRLQPDLPFLVDARVNIGPVPTGQYDMSVDILGDRKFHRAGVIRIVVPEGDATGLIHSLRPADGFHRPGDRAEFTIQGSGFRPEDAERLEVRVDAFESVESSFTYIAPGRIQLQLTIPEKAKPDEYNAAIRSGESVLLNTPVAFIVVPENWTRQLVADPPLKAGMEGKIILIGRDLDSSFVDSIKTQTAVPGIQVGPFHRANARQAVAVVSVSSSVAPGDYWIKLRSGNTPIRPQFGSIVRVN